MAGDGRHVDLLGPEGIEGHTDALEDEEPLEGAAGGVLEAEVFGGVALPGVIEEDAEGVAPGPGVVGIGEVAG